MYQRSQLLLNLGRPKTVDEVAHQDEVVKALKKSLETGNLPHLLFYGPPGTGKTSTILAIAMDLYGPAMMKDRVLELNASDERGIDIVRTKIKNFASFSVNQSLMQNGQQGACFKLIILDEADSMTHDAQAALRRTIESTSKTTRFCLLCNYITKIIEPLASRCAKFRFKPLDNSTMMDRLRSISLQERVKVDDAVLNAIHKVSEGDMRKAITYLQSSHRFYGASLSEDSIYNISGTVPPKLIDQFLTVCRSNSFDKLQTFVQQLIAQGYPASQVISQMFDHVVVAGNITNKQKGMITMKIGEIDRRLVDGSEEFIQLFDLGSFILTQFQQM
eukprot:gene17512-20892_t